MTACVLTTDLPFAQKIGTGKVRDLYLLNGDLLLITTDRLSAFDVVMDQGIPGKGQVLTSLSKFWFDMTQDILPNHMLSIDVDAMDDIPDEYKDQCRGRTMRCRQAQPLPVEWVVRGYLTGSGLSDYNKSGMVSGITLPKGMQNASQIEPAILTPSTKAEEGHDLPIDFDQVISLVGEDVATKARDAALAIYQRGRDYAAKRGIVIADTKFEFGLLDGQLIFIDECLTPDSSRFWPADEVKPGGKPRSYDKQLMRDYLSTLDWNKEPPGPELPAQIIQQTAETYADIYQRLTQ